MKKIFLLLGIFLFSVATNAQDLVFAYNQGGYNWQGYSTSDSYVLGCGNLVCEFDASFSKGANGTIIMSVYNPSNPNFIPATYYIYQNNTFDLYANGYKVAVGQWGVITPNGNVINFTGSPKHYHIDEHIPWNLCDICGKHKLYW